MRCTRTRRRHSLSPSPVLLRRTPTPRRGEGKGLVLRQDTSVCYTANSLVLSPPGRGNQCLSLPGFAAGGGLLFGEGFEGLVAPAQNRARLGFAVGESQLEASPLFRRD